MALEFKTEYQKYSRYYQSFKPVFTDKSGLAYTMAIFSFIALSVFGGFAIRPTLATITTLRKQIEDQRFLNQKMDEKIRSLTLAQKEYSLIQNIIPKIYASLPEDPEIVFLIQELERMTAQSQATFSGLNLGSVTFSREKRPNKLLSLNFNFVVRGDFNALDNFLKNIPKLKRTITINNLKITPKENLLEVAIDASYYFKEGR